VLTAFTVARVLGAILVRLVVVADARRYDTTA
jgi:hypothetical protein